MNRTAEGACVSILARLQPIALSTNVRLQYFPAVQAEILNFSFGSKVLV